MEIASAHGTQPPPQGPPSRSLWLLLAAALVFFPLGRQAQAADDEPEQAAPVRIGMVSTLFRDVPQPLMMAMMHPFGSLMKAMTGVNGELVPGGEPDSLGQQLAN